MSGFVILAVILGGLLSYLGVQAFFLVNSSWLAPTIVSPSDERILTLNAQVAQQSAARDKLVAEASELESLLADADRIIIVEASFQEKLRIAVENDRAAWTDEMRKLAALRSHYDAASREFALSNQAFSGIERVQAEQLSSAKLVDRETYLRMNQQLAQMSMSSLEFQERNIGINRRIELLSRETQAMRSIGERSDSNVLGHRGSAETVVWKKTASVGPGSVGMLQLEREATRSALELARAEGVRAVTIGRLEALARSVTRYDRLLEAIRTSPYLKAIEGNLNVAFVPYENLDSVSAGAAVYGCRFKLFWCRKVGHVTAILDGEVTMKHPVRADTLRGVMVELTLDDPHWAKEQLLHAKGRPLFL
ncbi:hypothetical protein AKJ08_0571 [Vulgatibacter incomptus]|uniref:Uncharacterized protein n=1 Tax=Vulgatibacter incomptus TaxID=1391653 RepID=A0A0K1PAP5_9BACT|nr:hypothetical protein AKJ08_0571 [Vulgatibacter incomptus]